MKKNFLFFVFVFILYGEEIKVLFTPSKKTYFEFIDLLQKAEKSIYISTFSISSEFVKFLENKKIDIKILCEYSDIKNFNIKKIKKKGIFHSKFIIIDEKVSIITSANLTFTNFYKNHNNLVIIENENVAKYLLGKFNSFWNDYNYTEIHKEGNIEIWFSPENNCELLIEREIKNANFLINFATFTFTSKNIAEKLIEKLKNRVEVKGIIENYNIAPYSVFYILLSYGCDIKKSCTSGFIHDKFFIFDKKKVITGSFNPTKSAKENVEIICFINDKRIAEIFYREWKSLYLFKSIKEDI